MAAFFLEQLQGVPSRLTFKKRFNSKSKNEQIFLKIDSESTQMTILYQIPLSW